MSEKKRVALPEEIGSYDIKSTEEKVVESIPHPLKEEYLAAGMDSGAIFTCLSLMTMLLLLNVPEPIKNWKNSSGVLQQKKTSLIFPEY